jgi:cell division protein FtsQ
MNMTSKPTSPRQKGKPAAPTAAARGSASGTTRRAAPGWATPQAALKVVSQLDLRIMRAATRVLLALLALVLLLALARWSKQTPLFALRGAEVVGALHRVNLPTLRAQVAPRLLGNFFGLDLDQARSAFETVPWVRRAEVRRVWPDRLLVRLEEHRPAAVWEGGDESQASERLVNDLGEVFEAHGADLEDAAASADTLPSFMGPQGQAGAMLALYRRLTPLLAQMEQRIDTLQLSDRGSWRAELRSGAVVELGRGSEEQLVQRTARFVATVTEATSRWQAPLEVADLRHSDGYALRLRGISVAPAASGPGSGGAVKTALSSPSKRTN